MRTGVSIFHARRDTGGSKTARRCCGGSGVLSRKALRNAVAWDWWVAEVTESSMMKRMDAGSETRSRWVEGSAG